MKKIITASIIALFALTLTVPAHALTPVIPSPYPTPTQVLVSEGFCQNLGKNMGVGSRGAGVTELQKFLNKEGLLKVKATGFYGTHTFAAVRKLQKSFGVIQTGYVGPLTRAALKTEYCATAVETNGLKVTSPKGHEVWQKGTDQTISWTDSKVYIQAPKYDVKVQLDLDCKAGQPCILLYPIPTLIAKDVASTSISWNVGQPYIDPAQAPYVKMATLADGKYRVYVCAAGKAADDISDCAKAASYVTIKTTLEQPITYGVTVPKKIYSQTEKFDVIITAKNNSSATQTLKFTNSCEVSYKVGEHYHYLMARLCAMVMGEVEIKAGETKTWTLTHDPAEMQLPKGTHVLEAEVVNNGKATTTITIN